MNDQKEIYHLRPREREVGVLHRAEDIGVDRDTEGSWGKHLRQMDRFQSMGPQVRWMDYVMENPVDG